MKAVATDYNSDDLHFPKPYLNKHCVLCRKIKISYYLDKLSLLTNIVNDVTGFSLLFAAGYLVSCAVPVYEIALEVTFRHSFLNNISKGSTFFNNNEVVCMQLKRALFYIYYGLSHSLWGGNSLGIYLPHL